MVYALFPVSIIGAFLTPLSFWEWGGGGSLVLIVGEMFTIVLYATLGPLSHLLKFSLLGPVLRMAQLVGCLKTIGTRTITWGGVRYTFDKAGKVTQIER
jgi:hypothetical protein